MTTGALNDSDHKRMDDFLSRVFDGVKSGAIEKKAFISCMAHVMAALDIDNTGEAVKWFNQKDLEFFDNVSKELKSNR